MRPTGAATDHAIIIGIDRYLDRSLDALRGARRDARAFYRWVTDPRGGAVPRRNVLLVAPPSARTREATLERLRAAFVHLCSHARGRASIGRRLYVFLAGHGIAQNRDEASLLAADGGPSALHRHIPGWAYTSWFMYAAYFAEVVLFADCCRTSHREVEPQPFPLADIDAQAAGLVDYVKGFAVRYGESAVEPRTRGANGLFTKVLIEALRNAYRDGKVTAESVEEYLHNHPMMKEYRAFQEPSFVAEGDVVFAKRARRREPRTRVRLRLASDRPPRVEGGPRPGPWPVRPGRRPREFFADLPAGIYAAKVKGRVELFFEVVSRARSIQDVTARH